MRLLCSVGLLPHRGAEEFDCRAAVLQMVGVFVWCVRRIYAGSVSAVHGVCGVPVDPRSGYGPHCLVGYSWYV